MDFTELLKKYPPSEPCECDICKSYCKRPGWWTVEQAEMAVSYKLSSRMMMEISPEFTVAVLSPAFRGNEGKIAQNRYTSRSCGFLNDGLCELHGTDYLPLECSFCHHDRQGKGIECHNDIEENWKSPEGIRLVRKWCNIVECFEGLEYLILIEKQQYQSSCG